MALWPVARHCWQCPVALYRSVDHCYDHKGSPSLSLYSLTPCCLSSNCTVHMYTMQYAVEAQTIQTIRNLDHRWELLLCSPSLARKGGVLVYSCCGSLFNPRYICMIRIEEEQQYSTSAISDVHVDLPVDVR